MKRFLLSAMLSLLSLTALAHSSEMIFKGKGSWKNSAGESGDYALLLTKKLFNDGSFKITATIDKGDEEFSHTTYISQGSNGFLTVKNTDGVVIGWGYSYDLEPYHICHLEMTPEEGVKIELTIKGNLDEFHAIGSMTNQSGYMSWIEHANRIYPKE